GVVGRPPHPFQQLPLTDQLARIRDQGPQQLPLRAGQVHDLAGAVRGLDPVLVQVDAVPADRDGGPGSGADPPPGDGSDAGEQFVDTERLGDVVVRSGVQRVDLVAAASAAGQHDDRYRRVRPQPADDLDAVDVR